jgi:hypothetical protein
MATGGHGRQPAAGGPSLGDSADKRVRRA